MSKLISLFRFFRVPMIALGFVIFGGGLLYLVTPGLWRSYHLQTWGKVTAKSKLEQYSTGRPVSVYYNPSDSGLSCLEQERPTLTSVLGLIMGVVSFYAAFALIKQVGNA